MKTLSSNILATSDLFSRKIILKNTEMAKVMKTKVKTIVNALPIVIPVFLRSKSNSSIN